MLERAYRFERAEIADVLVEIVATDCLVFEAADDVTRSVLRYRQGGPGFSDLMILAAANQAGAEVRKGYLCTLLTAASQGWRGPLWFVPDSHSQVRDRRRNSIATGNWQLATGNWIQYMRAPPVTLIVKQRRLSKVTNGPTEALNNLNGSNASRSGSVTPHTSDRRSDKATGFNT